MTLKVKRALLLAVLLLGLLAPTASATEAPLLRPVVPLFGPVPDAGVHVVGKRQSYLYVVQGAPQTVRGIGYNAPLSALVEDARLERMRVDFALMRRVGINTVLGWDQPGFDRAMLDVAQANGIGVIMHFELGKGWPYEDAELRARLLGEIGAWVDEYRDHPAVRMWGVGNEVMLTMSDDEARQFAEFYVDVYEKVREHDVTHPVIYREAEDVRVPFFREAFEAAGVTPEGFVFGMNFYTPRIAEALTDWAAHGFDVPVLISEFAPAGVPPSARADALQYMWSLIRPHERFVLGAAPYAWTIDGPEAVDRIFGLTDGQGRPVDPALGVLQRIYRGPVPSDEQLPVPAPVTPPPGLELDAAFAQAMARAVAAPDFEPLDMEAVRAEARQYYAEDLARAPGAARANRALIGRMLDLLVETSVLAALRVNGAPAYPGAVEALPLLAGMGRWSAGDPHAAAVAEAFLGEVLNQALRLPLGTTPTPA